MKISRFDRAKYKVGKKSVSSIVGTEVVGVVDVVDVVGLKFSEGTFSDEVRCMTLLCDLGRRVKVISDHGR